MAVAKAFDAIIVGSGATGGWAAKILSAKGLRVLVLEAGRRMDPSTEYTDHKMPYEMPFRGFGDRETQKQTQPVQQLCYACDEYGQQFFVNDIENPYTTPPDKPFAWIRARQVGGRTIQWGRQSYRFSDLDLKAASRDGYGDDWPIAYADIAPYYDLVEEFVGVSGSTENMPQLPDGRFLPPMEFTCGERLLKRAVERMGDPRRRVIMGRAAILTKNVHESTDDERAACHWCGKCERGCITYSYFCSAHSTLPSAERTGRMTLVTNAVVREVLLDKATGKARGVAYIDGKSKREVEAKAKLVLLCAGALESTRILLNSRSVDGAEGLANSSGVLGHCLMDHASGAFTYADMPMLDASSLGQDGRANGIYIPRFRNIDDTSKGDGFLRGYGYQGSSTQSLYRHAKDTAGFGADFKKAVRERHPWSFFLIAFAECLARFENHVRINKSVVDKSGHSGAPHRHEVRNERAEAHPDASQQARAMLEATGATSIRSFPVMSTPGLGIHEVGTARMGIRSEEVGAEQVQPSPRREKPVRDRRSVLRVERVSESDTHDDGTHGARVRLRGRRAQSRAPVTAASVRAAFPPWWSECVDLVA